MLKVSSAQAGYGTAQIIRDITINVSKGEIVALLGRNGVGKTTLMKYIMGLTPHKSGHVELDGCDLSRSPTPKRAGAGLGYVPQGRLIFSRLTVLENIRIGTIATGRYQSDLLEEIMRRFPILAERPNMLAGNLSGGQQQILAIARALATEVKVLLLDEASEGIQPSIVDEIHDFLFNLNKTFGTSMLIAEQNFDFAVSLASRVYVMDKGTIVQDLSSEDLISNKEMLHDLLGV